MIVSRFREIAAREGGRVALEDAERTLTYAELDACARRIARGLVERGVARDHVIAIRTDDRASIVCGMLGAWYSGAAFLVVTSDVPELRAARMMRDADVVLTIDDTCAMRQLEPERAGDAELQNDARSGDLAYVVFTSGTTGTPKGVLVTHAGLVPMLDAQIEAFALRPGARVAWTLSPLFDASISDIWTALLSGATLVAHAGLTRLAPRAMFERIGMLGITHADVAPSVLALAHDALPSSLETIVVGGEPCAAHVVRHVASRVRLVNVYGPTEATVCTSLHVCDANARHGARIGMPLPGVRYRIEADELLIGGVCVARGYASDTELTTSRFVTRDGERFYRTGDRVRVRDASGELEIVGRVDRQIKIAGVRIEPEEIESRLRDEAGVVDVAVLPIDGKLWAFVVARIDVAELRARLARSLPAWLVPSRFVAMEALPRTPTGKIDLGALAKAAECEPSLPCGAHEGSSDVERVLCDALGSALGVSALSRDADFAVLGGDSFAALVASAACDEHGLVVSPETIVTERTPARIAASAELCGASTALLATDVEDLVTHVETLGAPARSAFVTGATGALGSRLIVALARAGVAVTCLVRAESDAAAQARLVATLEAYGDLPQGIRAVAGNVERPRFGLPSSSWGALAMEHDAIVHAAAELALTSPYATLRATNVLGTAHALAFAREGAPKTFHHVSTLSVFASTDLARSGRTFDESTSLYSARFVHGGYAQSKWAAEALVRASAPDAFVHRLGLLLPGRGRDLFGAFVRGVAALGCVPDDDALRFDVTPVSFAASAIAHVVVTAHAHRTWHIAGRALASIDDLVAALEANGVRVVRTAPDAFRECVLAHRTALDGLALASFRALGSGDAFRAFDLFEATQVEFGAARANAELARAGIAFPDTRDVLEMAVRDALAKPGR